MTRKKSPSTPEPGTRPYREVRAAFSDTTVRVYQAYSPEIARRAVAAGRFVPPFSMDRMTWIKPSFTWMMYRAGWGDKPGQEHILAIDILRTGFEEALSRSCLSHFDKDFHESPEAWKLALKQSPVRIQWDPERTLQLQPLPYRAVQIGLEGEAVRGYVDTWIQRIEDITDLSKTVRRTVTLEGPEAAAKLLPEEVPYPLPPEIARHIGCTERS